MKPDKQKLQQILAYINTKKYDLALLQTATLLKQFPNSGDLLNLRGVAQARLGRIDEAIESFQHSMRVNPENALTYYNLANAQKEKGRAKDAISSYKTALKYKPDYVHALRNIANIYLEQGDIPNAFSHFEKALKIESDFADGIYSLIQALTSHRPISSSRNPIMLADRKIRETYLKLPASERCKLETMKGFFRNCLSIINQTNLPRLSFPKTQIFRTNVIAPDCDRHMSLFENENIISEFCFGCFKVQVEPVNVVDLIRLHFLFDEMVLSNNNSRKCMIETRPAVKGFYKGLIYCNSLDEAAAISHHLDSLLAEKISPELKSAVKRGCSEYAFSYPEFAKLQATQDKMMPFNEDWRAIETSFDAGRCNTPSPKRYESLVGICLHDVLVISNWLGYAKEIGDSSANTIGDDISCPSFVRSMITARSAFTYQELTNDQADC